MNTIEENPKRLGIQFPTPAAPVTNYIPAITSDNTFMVSGQLCLGGDGKLDAAYRGKLGNEVSLERGQELARLCAINLLARTTNDLGRICRCLRLGGFINSTATYESIPQVMNGASHHERAVKVEATFEIELS